MTRCSQPELCNHFCLNFFLTHCNIRSACAFDGCEIFNTSIDEHHFSQASSSAHVNLGFCYLFIDFHPTWKTIYHQRIHSLNRYYILQNSPNVQVTYNFHRFPSYKRIRLNRTSFLPLIRAGLSGDWVSTFCLFLEQINKRFHTPRINKKIQECFYSRWIVFLISEIHTYLQRKSFSSNLSA